MVAWVFTVLIALVIATIFLGGGEFVAHYLLLKTESKQRKNKYD